MTDGQATAAKAGVKRVGFAIAAVACAYFAYALLQADWSAVSGLAPDRLATALLIAIPAYGAASLLLVAAWRFILGGLGTPLGGQGRAYATTQAMKYLPGNVGHIVLRHAAARSLGASHQALAIAAIVELALVALAAGLVCLLATPGLTAALIATELCWPLVILTAVCALAFGAAALVFRRRLAQVTAPLKSLPPTLILTATATYTGFFILCGLIQVWLAATALDAPPSATLLIIGSGALAWLAGFLTPGAPAGIGVREAVLLLALSPTLGAPTALALAALYRLTTVGGDLLLAALAWRPATTPTPTTTLAEDRPLP